MSWIDGLRHRLHVLLHREAYSLEQAEERRFHREMEAIHGGPGGDILSRASTPLSPRPPTDEERGITSRALDVLRQDLGYAIRGLTRAPGFALLAVLTLALGVGANGAVFSVLDQIFGQPPAGVEAPDELRRLYIRFPDHPLDPGMVFPFFNYPALSAVDAALESGPGLAAWTPSGEQILHHGDRELTVRASWVTHDYFDVLGVDAARGRLFGEDEAGVTAPRQVVIISHAFWERSFGSSPDVVGQTLRMDSTTFTVIGVTGEGFAGLDLSYTDVFLPLGTFPAQGQLGLPWYEWTGNYFHAVTRPAEGAADEQIAERATAGYRRQVLPQGRSPDSTAVVVPGSIIAARGVGAEAGTPYANQAVSLSTRMAGLSLIVLLIAGVNVAGLLLVRSTRRRHEMAVRRALGVSRGRLLSQLATEGLLLTALAVLVAVPLAGWGGAILRRLLLPDIVWARGALDVRAVLFAIASAVAVGILAALTPALQSWWGTVGAGLKVGSQKGGRAGSALRSGLLAAQAALAVVLLAGAGLFIQSLQNVTSLRLGFDVEELAWISLRGAPGADELGVHEDVAARLASIGGISGAAIARAAPMMGSSIMRISLRDRDSLPDFGPGAYPAFNTVSPEFFEVTGMRILEGRSFADGEENAVVVSETMARALWPGESVLGRCLYLGDPAGPCQEVVGVAEDSRRMRIMEDPGLQYFRPREADTTGGVILLRVDPRRWATTTDAIRTELTGRFGPREVSIRRMPDALEPQLRPWRLGAQLFTAFGVLALVVTIVGVYSVMAYAVSQRIHEMGVRMALGAGLERILRLIVGAGLRVIFLGVAIGIAAALAMGRIVESLLYEVTPQDPLSLAWAAGLLLLTGATASLIPAWRAGRVDPARTLREE